ncbi:MAG: type II toxin-antitoxin system VapC family toxin [Phycisphaerae bacterium]|nr:type II toxin-antitoxin system VapC family toxin [Phycisphaerae bacterium]
MIAVFADTFYYLALLNADDAAHERAVEASDRTSGKVVTTAWVLTEIADALAAPDRREDFLLLLRMLKDDSEVIIVPATQDLFDAGIELFAGRADKDWSLTDCISLVVMQEHGITDVLTGDHHFEQAGFVALLKRAGAS